MKKLDESLIASLPPFRQLSSVQIREILDLASPLRIDADATIFSEGHDAGRFYLLLDGHIRVVRHSADGEQIISLHIPPGQLFGIAAALGRTTYPASAVAAAECIALSWPMSRWDSFVTKYPGFATETYKVVGGRVEAMNSTIMEMATKHVEQRIACAILRLVQQGGKRTEQGIEIGFPVTRQNISEMTGTTLHTVSRLLSAWEKDGILASKRKHVCVTNAHRLVELSGA
ncbi:Crp/Fnr family transcriptional regulator (plasmid) [Aestuarium zhoushanense]|nr:Crp/Fnr family transcriptional regulator [Aestuarium zhoushanense]